MAAMRGPRLQVGSTPWVAEERSSALQIVQSEVEEFSFSARNEMEWLNEHMAGIFDENEVNFAEAFKTPGKLRGKTPRTIRKAATSAGSRAPLSDVFSATPNGASPQLKAKILSPKVQEYTKTALQNAKDPQQPSQSTQDSGYYGSQDINTAPMVVDWEQSSSQKSAWPSNPAMFSTKLSLSRAGNLDSQGNIALPKTMIFSDKESSPLRQVHSSSPLKYSMNVREPLSEVPAAPDTVESKTDDVRSASDGSSPIRPVVRKSSLNFASLPAREPLGAGKTGGRVSRTSYLEPGRASYYQRAAGGKSLGNFGKDSDEGDEHHSDMDIDEAPTSAEHLRTETEATSHTKTYTQRLQDQINQLGKSNAAAITQAKSAPSVQNAQQTGIPASQPVPASTESLPREQSIHQALQTTPGAFPNDEDEDDWIEPPATAPETECRPNFPKSYSADVMEGIHSKQTIGQPEFATASHQRVESVKSNGHGKSASSTLPIMRSNTGDHPPLAKSISTSGLSAISEASRPKTPSDSPSRLFRDSPLKQVKNKLSSILKSSRGLLASSAAISAEGKSSMLSPSTSRLGVQPGQSSESVASKPRITSQNYEASQASGHSLSPSKSAPRRTRASAERQKEEQRREKEAKLMTEQMDKLDKAREKEREKARVFSKEQEKISAMEKEIALKKQEEKALPLETPKATRSSPRKVQVSGEDATRLAAPEVEMAEAPSMAPPPSAARTAGTLHALRNREVKRPLRPMKDAQAKTQQARTVIRVKAGSQHSQFHSAASQSTNSQDHAGPPSNSQQLNSKSSKSSLQSSVAGQNLKLSTNARANALEAATKKRELEEREAQKRREAKAEVERKRLAAQEEQKRQEQQKRAEIERQKKEKEAAEEKKNAQRQAAIEKAKQTKAPPPAVRSQTAADSQGGRPPSRVMTGSHRQPEDQNRTTAAKQGVKRTVATEATEDSQDRRPESRAGAAYQAKDGKRRRTSEAARDEVQPGTQQQHIKGPPLRPSAQFKKDLPSKPLFSSGYSKAPPSAARDLFKATVVPQPSQAKGAHPLDMAQISKAAIPFAPNANPAGPAFKTPGRPGQHPAAKSAAKPVSRPSPQYPNGENIDLPDIPTDDEDEEDDAPGMAIADWANSPFLTRDLERQQLVDPLQIFGAPGPINMEEVFSKSKDRHHKFRDRTSSANWSGADRLTEDDIRKDLAAREKLRREGGWSYQMGRDMI